MQIATKRFQQFQLTKLIVGSLYFGIVLPLHWNHFFNIVQLFLSLDGFYASWDECYCSTFLQESQPKMMSSDKAILIRWITAKIRRAHTESRPPISTSFNVTSTCFDTHAFQRYKLLLWQALKIPCLWLYTWKRSWRAFKRCSWKFRTQQKVNYLKRGKIVIWNMLLWQPKWLV